MVNLAREWTQGTNDNPYLMARAIEIRLRETFEYSLVQSSQGNFIQDFLLRTRSGHCEYFATSMAILLRLLGVPTRVVNGYYSAEWDQGNQAFIVRQKDAHAWVEVYMGDAVGWMSFDPTPSSGVSRTVSENRFVRGIRELMDSIRLRWYRNVIDFSIQDQTAVRRAIFAQNGLMARMVQVVGQANTQRWDRGWTEFLPGSAVGIALVLVGASIMAFILRDRIVGFILRLRIRTQGRVTTVQFYAEILHHLARRGLKRRPDQTPREFASEVVGKYEGLEDFPDVTETYYAVRFGDHVPTQKEHQRYLTMLLTLRKWNRKKHLREGPEGNGVDPSGAIPAGP
jgi:hypothetical protein